MSRKLRGPDMPPKRPVGPEMRRQDDEAGANVATDVHNTTKGVSIRQMTINNKRAEAIRLVDVIEELLQQEQTPARDKRLRDATGQSEAVLWEIKALEMPIKWQGTRRDGIAYLQEAQRKCVKAFQKDRKLRDMIAAWRVLASEVDEKQFDSWHDPRLVDAARDKIQQATEEITRFVTPSVGPLRSRNMRVSDVQEELRVAYFGSGGDRRRLVVDAPHDAAGPIDMIMQNYVDLANTRVRRMATASARELLEMDAGAVGLDTMFLEHLTDMKRRCNISDADMAADVPFDQVKYGLWLLDQYRNEIADTPDIEAGAAESGMNRRNDAVSDSGLKRDDSMRRVVAMPARARGFQHSLECVAGTEERETEFRKRTADRARNQVDQDRNKNAHKLENMRSQLAAMDVQIEKKRIQRQDVERKIEETLEEQIIGLVNKLKEKEKMIGDLSEEQYDELHREEVVAIASELEFATRQYDQNLARHREKNAAAAGSRAAGS